MVQTPQHVLASFLIVYKRLPFFPTSSVYQPERRLGHVWYATGKAVKEIKLAATIQGPILEA